MEQTTLTTTIAETTTTTEGKPIPLELSSAKENIPTQGKNNKESKESTVAKIVPNDDVSYRVENELDVRRVGGACEVGVYLFGVLSTI